MPLEMPKPNQRDAINAFLLSKRIGNNAPSPSLVSQNPKTTKETKEITKSAMMRPFAHGYVAPPHCKARSKQVSEPMMMNPPIKSSCRSFSRVDFLAFVSLPGVLMGFRNAMSKTPKRTPPNGRLIQKPHRHPIVLVMTPPMTGPMILETPSKPPMMLMNMALYRRGVINAVML